MNPRFRLGQCPAAIYHIEKRNQELFSKNFVGRKISLRTLFFLFFLFESQWLSLFPLYSQTLCCHNPPTPHSAKCNTVARREPDSFLFILPLSYRIALGFAAPLDSFAYLFACVRNPCYRMVLGDLRSSRVTLTFFVKSE